MLHVHTNGTLSFRTQLCLMVIPLILLPTMIVGYFSYNISYNALQARSLNDTERISTLANQNIDAALGQVISLARLPFYDQSIQNIVAHYAQHPDIQYPDPQDSTIVNTFLLNILLRDAAIRSVYIYTEGNVFFSDTFSVIRDLNPPVWKGQPWFLAATQSSVSPVIIPTYTLRNSDPPISVFSVAQAIVNVQTFQVVGSIFINVDMQAITRSIESSQANSDTRFLIYNSYDPNGTWIYPVGTEMLPMQKSSPQVIQQTLHQGSTNFVFDQTNYFLSSNTSALSNWTVVTLVPVSSLTSDIETIKHTTLFIVCLTLLCTLGVLLFFINGMSRPVTELRRLMRQVEMGDLDVRFYSAEKGSSEIIRLGESFNHMVVRLKQLIQDNFESQLQRQQAELAALQSQLNPHFLSNTLTTLQMIAIADGHERLARMSYALGQLMIYSLRAPELVDLKQELDHTHNFLLLMKERYEDRLHFEIAVPPDLYDCAIPKFALQPLVENAIYHGIDSKIGPGCISISGCQQDDILVLEIRDDGIGIGAEELERLQAALRYEANVLKRSRHIGMFNVQHQLLRLFGTAYGIVITSRPMEGTTVTIRLPIQRYES